LCISKGNGRYDIWWDVSLRLDSMEMKDFCVDPPKFQYSMTPNGQVDTDISDVALLSCCKERYDSIGLADVSYT